MEKLKQGEVLVTGIKKNVKEDGRVSYNIYGSTPFDPYYGDNAIGNNVFSEWTVADCSSLKIGMVIVPIYGKGRENKAYLKSFNILSV